MSERIVRGTLKKILERYPETATFNLLDQKDSLNGSQMKHVIKWIPHIHEKIRVCLMLHNDKPIGWAWKIPVQDGTLNSIQMFILPQYRQMGFGKVLFQAITKSKTPTKFEVYPWNETARAFYTKVEAKTGLDLKKERYFHHL